MILNYIEIIFFFKELSFLNSVLIYFGNAESSLLHGLSSSCHEAGLLSGCGVRTSR